jgi:hypothetical protein
LRNSTLRTLSYTGRQQLFLAVFALTGSIAESARRAKIGRAMHYWWLREDAGYRAAFARVRLKNQAVVAEILEGNREHRAALTDAHQQAIAAVGELLAVPGQEPA